MTSFIDQKVEQNNEMSMAFFGSGGGFSTRFNASSYQKVAVDGYLKQSHSLHKFPPRGFFPTFGRATPDISALGITYDLITRYCHSQTGGDASASSVVSVVCG